MTIPTSTFKQLTLIYTILFLVLLLPKGLLMTGNSMCYVGGHFEFSSMCALSMSLYYFGIVLAFVILPLLLKAILKLGCVIVKTECRFLNIFIIGFSLTLFLVSFPLGIAPWHWLLTSGN